MYVARLDLNEAGRWDRKSDTFVRDTRFILPLRESGGRTTFFRLENGDVFSVHRAPLDQRQGIFHRKSDGSWELEEAPYRKLSLYNLFIASQDTDGTLGFTGDTLLRFDPKAASTPLPKLQALVRRVTAGADEVLFGGRGDPAITLGPNRDALLFEFAAATCGSEGSTLHQYRLDGADRDWSPWGRQAEARYGNLAPGTYRFHVRAKALDGRESEEGAFGFEIQAPWYESPLAYLAYAALLALLIWGARQWTVRREREKARRESAALEAQARALEATVAERTQEIAAQRDSINLLNEVGKEITASLDLETILFKLYERVNQIADASIFGVGLHKPEEKVIEYTLAIENGKRYEPYTRSTQDKNQFAVWCLENRRPVLINDIETEATQYVAGYQHIQRLLEDGSRAQAPASMIYLPLIAQDRVLGVLSVQSFKKNAYSEQHLSLLENLAAYTTIALDNASAYRKVNEQEQQVRERAAELATINRITQDLSAQLDPKELIRRVGEQVREVFHAPIAFVATLDRPTMMLHFPYTYGEDAESRPFGTGLTSQIIRTGQPLLINEDLAGKRTQMGVAAVGRPAASFLGVPIPSGGENVGVISVQTTEEEGRFTEADQRLLATIASAVGVALHNARLFEETRQAKAVAEDGRRALALIREETPGLVVLDVMMPEMNGFDVAAVLKNDPATMDIPIIILSILEDKERGFRLGVDRYLTKPIDTVSLFREVGTLLDQGKSHKKVMVVDEDSSTVRTLTEVLEACGYHVVESNGAELVTKAVSSKPDVIILNSLAAGNQEIVKSLRFEKGLENVLFLLYR